MIEKPAGALAETIVALRERVTRLETLIEESAARVSRNEAEIQNRLGDVKAQVAGLGEALRIHSDKIGEAVRDLEEDRMIKQDRARVVNWIIGSGGLIGLGLAAKAVMDWFHGK